MASPKSGEVERVAEALLVPGRVQATELVASIHAVNPTGLGLPPAVERRRYALKSRLQSRLILEFFPDLDVEPVQPGVIGLRYRPQHRDACHAVLSELSEDARSKVQFHLDTHEPSAAPSRSPANKSSRRAATLLDEGRKALTDYDYDTARRCFEEALEANGDDEAPALALLELLVDHLAFWDEALAVEERLGKKQLTPAVRTLLALAAAQAGKATDCRRLAHELESPRLAAAFSTLARQALERQDFAEVTRLVTEARAFDPSAPELVEVEAELARRKSAQREPAERELQALLSAGKEAEAERQAQSVLARWPESAPARKVLRELESKRTHARVSELELQAEAAVKAGDDETARARWAEAQALGATGLEAKLASAAARLEKKARAQRLEAMTSALRAAWSEASLGRYLELPADERREVRDQLERAPLEWLEVLGASGSKEGHLDVAAVLELEALKAAPRSAEDTLARLRPHEARVLRLGVGRELLAAAEAELERVAAQDAGERLRAAQRALEERQWKAAIELAEALQRSSPEAAARIGGLARAALEREARWAHFEELFNAGNHLEALGVLRAAERDSTEDATAWASRRAALSQAFRAAFQVEVFKSAEGFPTADVLGTGALEESDGLDARGEYAYSAAGFGHHLFVRKIEVRTSRVIELAAFALPEKLEFPDERVEGATLWLTSDDGVALQLAVEDWEVLRWHVAREEEGETIDGSLVAPGGRYQWLYIRHGERTADMLRIIDLERGKVHREMPKSGVMLKLAATAGGPRVWMNGFDREGRLFALGGAVERTLPEGVQELCVSPTGSGLLGLAQPDEEEEDEGLWVLHFPEGSSEPDFEEELADAFVDGIVQLATARDARASFVIYQGQENTSWLVAYVARGVTVERAWRVRCPDRALLLQDLEARRVVLMVAAKGGLRCVPLTREQPDFGRMELEPETRPPRLYPGDTLCGPHDDDIVILELEPLLRMPPGAARKQGFEALLARIQDKPVALARAGAALRRTEEGAEVRRLAATRFPTHPATKLDQAELAVSKGEWEAALEELAPFTPSAVEGPAGAVEGSPPLTPSAVEGPQGTLSPRAVAHWHHLRGLALFHLDRLEEARAELEAATTDDGAGCHTSGWLAWLEAMAGRDTTSSLGKLVEAVRKADAALAAGEPQVALEHLDLTIVWAHLDVQLAARLASAALLAPPGPRTRLMVSAFMREFDSDYRVRLPFGRLEWPADRLESLAAQARSWMEGIGGKPLLPKG